jgi:diguanylate cyclase (GGDEF)-like protein
MREGFNPRSIPSHLTESEARRLVNPAGISIYILSFLLIADGVVQSATGDVSGRGSIVFGVIAFLLNLVFYLVILRNPAGFNKFQNLFSIVDGCILAAGLWLVPEKNHIVVYGILLLITLIFVILWERLAAFLFILVSFGLSILILMVEKNLSLSILASRANFILMTLILTETVSRLTRSMRARIKRLETINEFARKIGASLEAEQVVNIVNAALQKAINADSYYLGVFEEGQLSLNFFYDDGEYFNNLKLPINGTLSGWVIEHQQPLFMPDLRQEADLEGVRLVIVGQKRTSLSWMGVPIITAHLKGILAVASYNPNAFDHTDMELLENLGQQAALALDNAYHHDQVEKQARLDSLTKAYNHGYFLHLLEKESENSRVTNKSLSLIMLDIDYFKQYNDNYGHLAGDKVLVKITEVILGHIHATDSVGRWGGEEFCVLLVETTGEQAHNIACRIQEKINQMNLKSSDGIQLHMPTISQGIAVYPDETDDIIKLVDLADKRLYIAKERGRNQIEPPPEHWIKIGSS